MGAVIFSYAIQVYQYHRISPFPGSEQRRESKRGWMRLSRSEQPDKQKRRGPFAPAQSPTYVGTLCQPHKGRKSPVAVVIPCLRLQYAIMRAIIADAEGGVNTPKG